MLWHGRYGHLHFRALSGLSQKALVRGIPTIENVEEFFIGRAIGKQHQTAFPHAMVYNAERALELVHIDLCGPITPLMADGNECFLLIVDDYLRYMWL